MFCPFDEFREVDDILNDLDHTFRVRLPALAKLSMLYSNMTDIAIDWYQWVRVSWQGHILLQSQLAPHLCSCGK